MLSRSHTNEGIHKHSKRAKNSTELLVNKQGSKEKLNFRNRVIQLKNKSSAKKKNKLLCQSVFWNDSQIFTLLDLMQFQPFVKVCLFLLLDFLFQLLKLLFSFLLLALN